MTDQRLLTAKHLGLLLALSHRQIFRLNSCGLLPKPLRIGGAVRWKLADIISWQDMGCPDRKTFESRLTDGEEVKNV